MTNLEKATRATLLQFILDSLGATELNPVKQVGLISSLVGNEALSVEMENGEKKILEITVTDSDE